MISIAYRLRSFVNPFETRLHLPVQPCVGYPPRSSPAPLSRRITTIVPISLLLWTIIRTTRPITVCHRLWRNCSLPCRTHLIMVRILIHVSLPSSCQICRLDCLSLQSLSTVVSFRFLRMGFVNRSLSEDRVRLLTVSAEFAIPASVVGRALKPMAGLSRRVASRRSPSRRPSTSANNCEWTGGIFVDRRDFTWLELWYVLMFSWTLVYILILFSAFILPWQPTGRRFAGI